MEFAASLDLFSSCGQFIRRIGGAEAAQLVADGSGTPRGTKRRWKVVILAAHVDQRKLLSAPHARHESHKCETGTNPVGVWELRKIEDFEREAFRRVVSDCMAD